MGMKIREADDEFVGAKFRAGSRLFRNIPMSAGSAVFVWNFVLCRVPSKWSIPLTNESVGSENRLVSFQNRNEKPSTA
jgi:hypothetical protein